MAYLTNREFAEQLFRQKKRNEYTDALMEEVRRLREENELLREQLAASQRRADAAVKDAKQGSVCRTCHYLNNGCDPLNLDAGCRKWQWHGQQAGEGDATNE